MALWQKDLAGAIPIVREKPQALHNGKAQCNQGTVNPVGHSCPPRYSAPPLYSGRIDRDSTCGHAAGAPARSILSSRGSDSSQ